MEGEDDGVAGLQRDEGLEDRGGGGVGHRGDARDDADGVGNLGDAGDLVVADDADRALLDDRVRDVLAREHVLHGLVFEQSTAGLFDGQDGEFAVVVESGDRCLAHDVVDLLLRERRVLGQSILCSCHECIDCGGHRILLPGVDPVSTPSS